ncbi:MAG: MFS transporter [Caldimicrobium sp.]
MPLYYALAMGVDALSARLFGYLFDKRGLKVLVIPILLSALSPPLVFFGGAELVLLGMLVWGVGLGAQESIMRASVALFTPKEKRATGYGIFHALFGLFWFLESLFLGFLYDFSLYALILVSIGLQLLSLPLLLRVFKNFESEKEDLA